MSRDSEKIEGEEKGVINLVPPDGCEGEPTTVIEVCGQRWRVLEHALEAIPADYLSALLSAPMRGSYTPWLCTCCGRKTETRYKSLWTPVVDVLCDACRDAGGGVLRHCPYCGQPLVRLLPVDVAGSLRYVVVCPLHHVYHIEEMEARND